LSTWRPDDGSLARGTLFNVTLEKVGAGREIAVAVSITQATENQTGAYISSKLPNVGMLVSFVLPSGPGHRSIAGGEHASALAEQVSNTLRGLKSHDPDALVHIFAASPNTFIFFLGQHQQSIAPCIVYEFDYDRRFHKTYQPSFTMD